MIGLPGRETTRIILHTASKQTALANMTLDTFHIKMLKPAGEREEPFSVTATDKIPPPSRTDSEFYVEKVLAFEQRSQGNTLSNGKVIQIRTTHGNGNGLRMRKKA